MFLETPKFHSSTRSYYIIHCNSIWRRQFISHMREFCFVKISISTNHILREQWMGSLWSCQFFLTSGDVFSIEIHSKFQHCWTSKFQHCWWKDHVCTFWSPIHHIQKQSPFPSRISQEIGWFFFVALNSGELGVKKVLIRGANQQPARQISFFASASAAVAVSGACLANSLYMRENALVLDLVPVQNYMGADVVMPLPLGGDWSRVVDAKRCKKGRSR